MFGEHEPNLNSSTDGSKLPQTSFNAQVDAEEAERFILSKIKKKSENFKRQHKQQVMMNKMGLNDSTSKRGRSSEKRDNVKWQNIDYHSFLRGEPGLIIGKY